MKKALLLGAALLQLIPQTQALDFSHPIPEYALGAVLASVGFVTAVANNNPSRELIPLIRNHLNQPRWERFINPFDPETPCILRPRESRRLWGKIKYPDDDLSLTLNTYITGIGVYDDKRNPIVEVIPTINLQLGSTKIATADQQLAANLISIKFKKENFYQKVGIASALAGLGIMVHALSRASSNRH